MIKLGLFDEEPTPAPAQVSTPPAAPTPSTPPRKPRTQKDDPMPKTDSALEPKPDAAARKALRIARLKKTLKAKRLARLAGQKAPKAPKVKAKAARKVKATRKVVGGRKSKEMLTLVEKRPGVYLQVKNATMAEICTAMAKGKKVLTIVEYSIW